MIRIEQLARAALAGDSLELRSLAQEWLMENPRIGEVEPPDTESHDLRVVAAALVELLAERSSQTPPSWTAQIGAMREPVFLVKAAATMPRLRQQCKIDAPLPLRRRGLYAPDTFLCFA